MYYVWLQLILANITWKWLVLGLQNSHSVYDRTLRFLNLHWSPMNEQIAYAFPDFTLKTMKTLSVQTLETAQTYFKLIFRAISNTNRGTTFYFH